MDADNASRPPAERLSRNRNFIAPSSDSCGGFWNGTACAIDGQSTTNPPNLTLKDASGGGPGSSINFVKTSGNKASITFNGSAQVLQMQASTSATTTLNVAQNGIGINLMTPVHVLDVTSTLGSQAAGNFLNSASGPALLAQSNGVIPAGSFGNTGTGSGLLVTAINSTYPALMVTNAYSTTAPSLQVGAQGTGLSLIARVAGASCSTAFTTPITYGTQSSCPVSVSAAAVGDSVICTPLSTPPAGMISTCYVSAAGNVSIYAGNANTSGSITLPTAWSVLVIR